MGSSHLSVGGCFWYGVQATTYDVSEGGCFWYGVHCRVMMVGSSRRIGLDRHTEQRSTQRNTEKRSKLEQKGVNYTIARIVRLMPLAYG